MSNNSKQFSPKAIEFIKRLTNIFDMDSIRIIDLLSNRSIKSLRINRIKNTDSTSSILGFLKQQGVNAQKLGWYADAILFPSNQTKSVVDTDLYRGGDIYIQNPSSYLPAFALLIGTQGGAFLDVCSAPGGKGSHFATLQSGCQRLVLNEPDPTRNKQLRQVLGVLGVKHNLTITNRDGRQLTKYFQKECFDTILLDVECSGEAGINFASKRPMAGWSIAKIVELSNLQLKMLTQAYEILAPGGVLVYSTCTFSPEENEGVISRFLERSQDCIVQKIRFKQERSTAGLENWHGTQFNSEVKNSLRVLPSSYMEGFFICVLRKPTEDLGSNKQLRDEVVDLGYLMKRATP